MDINKILSADFLDILFEGRNKEYGAYELRKTYNERIKYALIGTVVICALLLLLTLLANSVNKKKADIIVADVVLDNVAKEEKKPEAPPPPPPPKQEPPKVEITKFTPPKIVKDEEVKPDEEIKEVKQLEDTKIGKINQEGDKDQGVVAPPVESKGTGVVEAPKEENWDQTFTSVQIEAAFPGGQPAWQKYLERYLDRDIIASKGGPAGNYTVKVTFIVDKNGNISDVTGVLEGGGEDYGAIEEAVRVIKKGPKWAPGIQNGHQVKAYRSQRITFQVSDQ